MISIFFFDELTKFSTLIYIFERLKVIAVAVIINENLHIAKDVGEEYAF